MKKKLVKSLMLLNVLLFIVACTQTFAKDNKTENKDAKDPQQKLVKISTLGSIEANQEFQRNVQIMQAQRQRVVQLQRQIEETQTKDLKINLKKELESALDKLNKDNKKMAVTYGFSLNRNYMLVVEKAHIYMAVSEDEARKIEKEKSKAK